MLVIVSGTFSRRFLNISLNSVVGHVVGFRLGNDVTQTAVVRRVRTAAFLYGNSEFSTDFCKNLPLRRIVFLFLMLDIRKL